MNARTDEVAQLGDDRLLDRVKVTRKSGTEPFRKGGASIGFDLREFWGWSGSDLVGNTARGRLAEFIVAKALGVSTSGVREEWMPFDLATPEGVKIEVKSSAYLQSWKQSRLSSIQFSIRPARLWNPETNEIESRPARSADLYVFALLAHREKATLDPLDLDQWSFYVVPTRRLNEHTGDQEKISLGPLERLAGSSVRFEQLAAAVERASYG